MVEERQRSDWWHTAAILASIRNMFADRGKKVTPRDCHPMESKKTIAMLRGKQLSILRDVFCQPPKK